MVSISTFPLFDLGRVVVTPEADTALDSADEDVAALLDQYQYGYWGSLSQDDQRNNVDAIESGGGRILGRYTLWTHDVIYITTDPDWRTTTVMLPEEW